MEQKYWQRKKKKEVHLPLFPTPFQQQCRLRERTVTTKKDHFATKDQTELRQINGVMVKVDE